MSPLTQRFHVLDAWRGIAALLVALERLQANGFFYSLPIVRNSYLFVDFFFVLSGFVIAHAYGAKLDGMKSAASYALRRFGRLWPLHMLLLAMFVAFEAVKLVLSLKGVAMDVPPFSGTSSPATIMSNIALVHGLNLYEVLTWNQPSWSISDEFWTYLLFAAVCLVGARRLSLWSTMLSLAALLTLILVAPRGMDSTYDFGILRCIAGFFAGVVTQRLWQRAGSAVRPQMIACSAWLEPLVILAVMLLVSVAGRGPLAFLAPFAFSAMVFVLAFESGPVSRLMHGRLFQALGAWSYSIYMVNYFVVLMIERLVNSAQRKLGTSLIETVAVNGQPKALYAFGPAGVMDAMAVAYLAAVLALSFLTYTLCEAPARRFFNRLANRIDQGVTHDKLAGIRV